MKTKLVLVTLFLLAIGITSAIAGSERRIGTAGAQELLLPIGSRGTALGGAVVSNVSGVEAVLYNPAGLASLEGTEAMFSHLGYFADIEVNFGGVATAIEGFGTLAVAAKVTSIGNMEETTNLYPDGTGRTFNPTLAVLGVSYANQLTANVGIGATAHFLSESIFEVSATGVAFDIGFEYDPRWKGVKLGLVMKNYGPSMRFSGKGFERDLDNRKASPNSAAFDLPSYFAMGLSYNIFEGEKNKAVLSGNWRSNALSQDLWQGGAEYSYDDKYFLRAGYNYSQQNDYVYGLSLGAGLTVPLGGTRLTFEYAWTQTDIFSDNQFFTLRMNF